MKLTCPQSGISYAINSGYGTDSRIHPALEIPLKKLVAQLPDFHSLKLESPQDQYLYLLAWLRNLPTIQFRDSAVQDTDFPILLLHSNTLIKTVLSCQKFPHLAFPSIVVSRTSPISSCLTHWLEAHTVILEEQKLKASKQRANVELLRLESSLDRISNYMVRSNVVRASKLVATWTARAGDFSNEYITSPTGETITLSDYWQQIIILAFKESHTEFLAAKIPPADISELIEYCEDNIPHGTIYAYELMKRLRAAQKLVNELAGGLSPMQLDIDVTSEMLTKPERAGFESSVDFLRAKIKWTNAVLVKREQDKQAKIAQSKQVTKLALDEL